MKFFICTLIFCMSFSAMDNCSAWGGKGHALVGTIAEHYLTDDAKAKVLILLDGQSLAQVASWADQVKRNADYGYLSPTHYINLPRDATTIDLKRDGKQGENVVDAILSSSATLADRTASDKNRGIALKFLVHFVGDVHQPLHVSYADDRGGNNLKVQLAPNNYTSKLHAAWDSKLLNRHPQSNTLFQFIVTTNTEDQLIKWRKNADDPLAWAQESFTYTRAVYAYLEKNNNIVAQEEIDRYTEIIALRLAAAGVRLAAVINKALENKDAEPHTGSRNSSAAEVTNDLQTGK